ncbi:MAG: Fic family protein [Fibrobacteres bacterium]|nr:Fic family protein [Fibrobacterota bacterium]
MTFSRYIHELPEWPKFHYDRSALTDLLAEVRYHQGKLLGRMNSMGLDEKNLANLNTRLLDIKNTSEIEGDILEKIQIRSSLARRLHMPLESKVKAEKHVDDVVSMILRATSLYNQKLTKEELFKWHSMLFPEGLSGKREIVSGGWRNNPPSDPMQVVSGYHGKVRIHFQAPDSDRLENEITSFLHWFNNVNNVDPVLKSAIAHLWFVTVHPFDDGNGRIARAIGDRLLSLADQSQYRFYSMSTQILKERKEYYSILERTQRGTLDITEWLSWYLACLLRSINYAEKEMLAVDKLATFWKTYAKSDFNNRQIKVLTMLLNEFEGNLTTSKWAKLASTSHDTALRDINDLIERKIIEKIDSGGRSTAYKLLR